MIREHLKSAMGVAFLFATLIGSYYLALGAGL